MAFRTNENQQMSIGDNLYNLSDRGMRVLKGSWAEGFANHIFPNLPEEPFSVLYSDNDASKPNVPINIILGLFMLKEQFDLTDEEMVHQLMFNIQFQYALHTTSFAEQPVNDNTFRRFRNKVSEYYEQTGVDLVKEAFKGLRDKISGKMGLDPSLKRVDSLMISAGCLRLSRLNLMHETLRLAARDLARGGKATDESRKYEDDGSHADIGYKLKREEVLAKMDEMLQDALALIERYPEALRGSEAFANLRRMVEDQSKMTDDGRVLKEGKEISPESMQTPHDPEATYRKKAGKGNIGYVANIEESCDGDKRLVTDYDLQNNTYSDAKFAEDMVEAMPDSESGSRKVIMDGAYATAELVDKAAEKNIEIVTTSLIGGMQGTFEAEFEIDEESRTITRCPAGHEPIDCKYSDAKGGYRAHFDKQTCMDCPHCERCPGVFQKKTALIRFSDTARKRAQYAQKVGTDEYKKLAKFRNGIEGVQSVLRRKYCIDQARDKGVVRKRQRLGFKLMAMNAGRLIKWQGKADKDDGGGAASPQHFPFFCFMPIFALANSGAGCIWGLKTAV